MASFFIPLLYRIWVILFTYMIHQNILTKIQDIPKHSFRIVILKYKHYLKCHHLIYLCICRHTFQYTSIFNICSKLKGFKDELVAFFLYNKDYNFIMIYIIMIIIYLMITIFLNTVWWRVSKKWSMDWHSKVLCVCVCERMGAPAHVLNNLFAPI